VQGLVQEVFFVLLLDSRHRGQPRRSWSSTTTRAAIRCRAARITR
jgi:hypothetical protein